MLKMHLPRGAVQQKMLAEGIDPTPLLGEESSGANPIRPAPQQRRQPDPPAAKPARATGGMSLLDQIQAAQGGAKLHKVTDEERNREREGAKEAKAAGGLSLLDQIRAAQGGATLHKVTDEERSKDKAEKEAKAADVGGGGLMGAISAALNARREVINHSDSDSDTDTDSDDAPGDWSASDDSD